MNERYSRQIMLKHIGEEGQKIIQTSKIAIVGVGALGTNSAQLLVRAGVTNLTLIDADKIEESNLQRQTLFAEKDIGKGKAETAKQKLEQINSQANIKIITERIDETNTQKLIKNVDLVLDCTDNFKTRLILNKFCRKQKLHLIFASCVQTSGYVMPILPKGPCLDCFLKEVKLPTADQVGIINTIPASIAALQVTLAIKILLKKEVEPNLYYYNIWNQELKKIKINKNKQCNCCSRRN